MGRVEASASLDEFQKDLKSVSTYDLYFPQ